MGSNPTLTTLHFRRAGALTLIQDTGRSGHAASGIPASGAMDPSSASAANWCVGNPVSAPLLEITLIGPQIQFDGDCQIALAGADMNPVLNDHLIDRYTTVNVQSGSILSFGKLRSGCRAYLAVRGEWQVSRWLGSASALRIGDIDLVPQAHIQKGATITVQTSLTPLEVRTHPAPIMTWPGFRTIRVLPGPEFSFFSARQIAFFFNTNFQVASDSNRIGYRLVQKLPDYKPQGEMISSGIIQGTIQVTREGQPVILLADAQTVGGYPRIANVVSEDIDLIAQMKPGDEVAFSRLGN